MTNRELANFRPTDAHIRNWMAALDQRANSLVHPGETIDFSDEIKSVFDELIHDQDVRYDGETETSLTKTFRASTQPQFERFENLDKSAAALKKKFKLTDEQLTELRATIEGRN